MKKSRILTFLFSFMPGAGQMYLGLMKKGVSIMLLFFGIIAIGGFFIEPILFTLPIIWFYSFFDAINFNSMTYEQKVLIKDDFIFSNIGFSSLGEKKNSILGFTLVFLGIYTVFVKLARPFLYELADMFPYMYVIVRSMPTLIIAVFIILIGIKLVKRTPKDVEDIRETNFKEYEGNNSK